jgi:gamma-glutamylcyclotransferase
MLYFAYGSNMDFRELRTRCPSAQFVAVARLPHHRLSFTRYSPHWECGVANALPEEGETIWGVVYDIAEIDFGRLDKSEGFQPGRSESPPACLREQRLVDRNGHEADPILAWLYVAGREPHPLQPDSTYKGLLVDGARFWHLPADYVAGLERIEAV